MDITTTKKDKMSGVLIFRRRIKAEMKGKLRLKLKRIENIIKIHRKIN